MKDLIKETVEKIKKQGIAPGSRWKYLVKKYGTWTGFGAVVIFGAVSFSAAFDMLGQLDWDLYRFAHQSAIIYSLTLLPYFWMVLIGIFLALAFFDLRKTETGYKYGWLKMSLAPIGGIIAFGLLFSWAGLGGNFNMILAKDIPYYGQHLMMTKETQWMQPDSGFLAGSLTAVSNNKLEVSDLNGQNWNVFLDEKTLIRPAVDIAPGEMVKIIGSKKEANNFQAIEIRPWMVQGMINGPGRGQGNGMGGARSMMR